MDKFDRIFQLHAILSARRTLVPLEDLMARLECSRATLYRAVNTLKDQLNAPIVFDADRCGFVYELKIPYREARELVMNEARRVAALYS
jgi:predicted DNA-binding transcriptional regulator YafY